MKFKLTLEFTYEVPDEDIQRGYGTINPQECAQIDSVNAADDPASFLEGLDGEFTARVEALL